MYYFLANLYGGSGKAVKTWNKVKAELVKRNIEYTELIPEYAGHATQIARELTAGTDGKIKLVIVGGDGTLNEVINGIADFSKVEIGIIPTGSGNDFARGLSLPRSNPLEALDIILKSDGSRKIDLGRSTCGTNSRLFAISSGFGMDAEVGTKINVSKIKTVCNKLHLGSLSYSLLTIKILFSMKTMNARITFDDGEVKNVEKLIFLAGMNCFAEGGGVPMAPDAVPDDGMLSVCIASGIPKWKTFLKFPLLVAGKHGNKKGFYIKNCRSLDIESEPEAYSNTDGEFIGQGSRVKMEILPGILTVLY